MALHLRPWLRRLGLAALAAMAAAGASAQPSAGSTGTGWPVSVAITPYVWLPAMRGSLRTPLPRVGERDFDLSSGTVLTDLSTVPIMVAGELRYGRFLLLGDFFRAGLTSDIRTPRDVLFSGGHVRAITTFGTLLGMARAIDEPAWSVDLGAGARIWNFNNKISLDPGLLPGAIQRNSIGWTDPILAARVHARLSPSFALSVYGDVGGFDAGSRLTWQVRGGIDYAIAAETSLSAGWRYLSVDKTRRSAGVDLGMNGPFLAVTFRF